MNPQYRPAYPVSVSADQAVSEFFRRVFLWMAVGLAVTGVVALGVAATPALVKLIYTTPLRWLVMFAPLLVVLGMSAAANRLSAAAATGLFLLYSAINGVAFSFIFLVYTAQSIASVFFISAGMFGGLALFGYATKKDLSAMGRFMMMGLIGIIIASVVNMFLGSPALTWAVSVLGVFIFAGLTAYDTQKLRAYALANATDIGGEGSKKVAIFGALNLYLDFINIFLFLLRLFGDRRR